MAVHDHLQAFPAAQRPDLVAPVVAAALHHLPPARVFEVAPDVADTAAMCEEFGLPLDTSANCVLITGRRGGEEKHVAALALATTRVDVNGLVRRRLDARKASFAPTDVATSNSGMEYGGITPVGLPADWPVWIDAAVAATREVIIGAGNRTAKLLVPGDELANLPGAEVVEGLAS